VAAILEPRGGARERESNQQSEQCEQRRPTSAAANIETNNETPAIKAMNTRFTIESPLRA
jgi:hypothetical protein